MATTAAASFPLSPRATPPPASSSSPDDMRSSTSSARASRTINTPAANPYAVRDIPPFRPKAVQRTSTTDAASNKSSSSSATTATRTRERRTSQASNNSGATDSRRNSGQFMMMLPGRGSHPSPTLSSPAASSSSPTHALAQFFPSSSTLPAGLSSLTASSSSNNGPSGTTMASTGSYANPSLANSIGPGSSMPPPPHHAQQQAYQYYSKATGQPSPGMAMLQGIEAQLQMPPYNTRSGSSNNSSRNSMSAAGVGGSATSSSASSSNTASRRQSSGIPLPIPASPATERQHSNGTGKINGSTHRIPATHQTAHRPASTTIVPVHTSQQLPSLLASPPMQYHDLYQQQQNYRQTPSSSHQQHQNLLYTSSANTAPQLSQSTRAPFPAPLVVPPFTNTNSVSAGPSTATGSNNPNHRNRASHQIVPLSATGNAPPQIPTIALHTAQYSNPGRQKVFFGDYQLLHTLGEGEFGKVKLGVHAQRWGEEVAIKLIKKGSINDAARSLKVQREIDVLRLVRHPHIVRLVDVVETDRYIGIVLEYASGGELFEYILAHKHLRENVACKLFAQLISGVGYLHSKKVVHRDLKLENLLLDRNRNIIITDFGFANRFDNAGNDLMATSCGSPCYAAPELVLQDGQYVGSAVDVWSCGVILYAMLSGYLPYDDDPNNPDGDNINLLYRYITTTKLSFPDWISPEPRDLLLSMLVPDPNKRCSLKDVMRHPWLSRYAGFFKNTVLDLEAQADAAYEEKRMLLQRQQQAYYRQLSMSASGPPTSPQTAMARSMSTPGVTDTPTAQQRHRSAMVAPVAGVGRSSLATQLPTMQETSSQWVNSSTTRSETMPFIDPFAPSPNNLDSAQSSAPIAPVAETLSPASTAMMASNSAPGDFEGTSADSLTTEGEMRGTPRSRRTDDDDASTTSSARATRSAVPTGKSSTVSSPSKSSSNGSSDVKRRKGDEKRHTVQLEYTSPPPAESTRSKTKARESLNASQVRVPVPSTPSIPTPVTVPQLPSFAGSPPAIIPSNEFSNLPLIEATAAADTVVGGDDVHMASANTSPARSIQISEESAAAPSTPPSQASPVLFVKSVTSPAKQVARGDQDNDIAEQDTEVFKRPAPREVKEAAIQATPPTSPSKQAEKANRTPRRTPAASTAELIENQRTPRASAQSRNTERTTVPFPSPIKELQQSQPKPRPVTMAATVDRNGSTRSQNSTQPSINTQSSSRSSQRHRKGLSTDRAFFSRLLGSSTTSVNKLDAAGEGSRSRTSSSNNDDRPVLSPSQSTASGEEFVHDNKRGAGRRKALSLVVDPFGRSSNGPGASGARNRRSTKIPLAVPIAETGESARTGSGPNQATSARTSNIPMSPSMPISPSLQSVNQPLRQMPPYNDATSSPFSTRTSDSSKSKRVSDWFRWKSVNRNSTAYQPTQAAPDVIKTDFDKPSMLTRSSSTRQKRQSVVQPKVMVTGATPQQSEYQRQQQQQASQVSPRVVATPADARNLTNDTPSLLTSQRSIRGRRVAAEAKKPMQFDDSKLKVHSGVTNKRIVTKTPPPQILEEVRGVLAGMGMQVVPDTDYRLVCTRKSRKQVAALVGSTGTPTPLTPSPGSTFRSFFSRKNSAATAGSIGMVTSPSIPSPALTSSSTMEGPEPSSLTLTTSAQSQTNIPLPYYGPSHDGGGEVRFTVEVVRVKHLAGLYTLDFRRLKGALTDYKENHDTCIERLNLGSAL